ncbi:MAG: carboxymuconolactone decarboxylase family protein [Burkholderiales bacterium]|nr:carboxymuconolactone decarboxylase family protein [Burkholderiales bacterium]
MPTFPIHTAADAPTAESRAALRAIEAKRGHVPNLVGALAASDTALLAYLELSQRYGSGDLSLLERQVVALEVNRLNQAPYCMAGHSAACEASGIKPSTLVALRNGLPLDNDRLEALRRFTRALVEGGGVVDDSLWQEFGNAGFTRAQALEVLVGISVKMFSNFASRMMQVPVDIGAVHWTWQPPAAAPAEAAP